MIKIIPVIRTDAAGDGHYGASRGNRTHIGIDYVVTPGAAILSPVDGIVTKEGYPYRGDMIFRYVQITDKDDFRHRLFYSTLLDVSIGDAVEEGQIVAKAQAISERYMGQGMQDHVHYEILAPAGTPQDPGKWHG